MKRLCVLFLLTLGLAASTALAASFTPGNVVVLQCTGTAGTGNAGALVEYTPSGTLIQTITLHNNGTTGDATSIVFGASDSLDHDISLSADGALVVIPGYNKLVSTGNVDTSTAASDNRVIATLKWDGTYAAPIVNSAVASGAEVRGATSDGFGNFWVVFTSGCRYVTPSAPTVSTTINGTGSRCCAIFNGQLYATVAAGADSVGSGLPTTAVNYNVYISGAVSGAGFAIPTGPTDGSKAYVANYNTSGNATIYPFTWSSGSSWTLGTAINLAWSGKPQHIAVDYSGANPVIYMTTGVGANNSLYKIVDNGAGGTLTTLGTATGGAIFRGVALAPTQPAAPVFTTMPANSINFYGDTVNFGPVAATGANPNAWTWKFGSITLTNGNNGRSSTVSGATTTTLTIAGVTAADVGSYYAIASNNGGSTSSDPATLTLHGSCISPPPVSITNVAGSTAIFTAGVAGCAGPLQSISWSLNGNGLSDGVGVTGTGSTISGSSTSSLTNAGVQDGDAGTYTITLFDANSQQSSASATLTILDPPGITQQPGNQTKTVGATANFRVTATGGSLFYNWFMSPSITPLTNGPSGTGSTISGATSSNLVITSVQSGDAGTYSVTITNLAGSTNSDPATLTVGVLPAVNAISDDTNVVGSDAVFSATVTAGTPPFTYTWKHNGTVMTTDGFHIFGADTATLGITNVDIPDSRLYALSVSNAYGGVTVSAHLYVVTDTNKPNDVADLIIYEPFDYPIGPNPAVSFYSWENIISIYNRVTGEPAYWINTGSGLYTAVVAWDPTQLYGGICRNGGGYNFAGIYDGVSGRFPYPGLDCAFRNKWNFSSSGCNNHLHFGGVSSGSVYFSLIFFGDQGGTVTGGTLDITAGFTSGNSTGGGANADTFAYGLGLKADVVGGNQNTGLPVDGPGGWWFGVFKGGGDNPGANGQWSTNYCWRAHPYLIVGCYKIVSGGTTTNDDIVSLWVEPPRSSFGADEAHVPPPDAGGMQTTWGVNAPITEFAIRAGLNAQPFSKAISDLRIGKTWASVTKPYSLTLTQAYSAGSVTLSWPAKDSPYSTAVAPYTNGYRLQVSSDLLNLTNWDATTVGLDGSGKTKLVTETPATNQFWRLDYPPRSGAYYSY